MEERKDLFQTLSGLEVDDLYEEGTSSVEQNFEEQAGYPGAPPFLRGVYSSMYRGRLWTMRQYSGLGNAEQTNERFRELLSKGQTGLSVAFDLPTQIGYDPDDEMAEGEVGRAGVSIATLDDMETLFSGIPLDEVSTSMTINATAPILVALYVAVAQEQGADPSSLRGTVQNDLLKEFIARGTYIYPPEPSLRLVVDLMEFCEKNMPKWNSISVSGYHIREKGATAPQEIAFTLANAVEYLRQAQKRDLNMVKLARRVSFFFSAHSDFFEEIAKFRAARRMWSRILPDKFGIDDQKARRLRFHTQTAGVSLTAQQPENNYVRVAFQALAAVLGGTQSLHTNAMDEALGIPTKKTATVALRTQQILAHETGVANTVDPLGGSYFVENLTDEVEEEATEIFEDVEEQGGAIRAVENGFMRKAIERTARRTQDKVESGELKIVGVNCYTEEEEEDPEIQTISSGLREKRLRALENVREKRNDSAVRSCLDDLGEAARNDRNILPEMIQCVKERVTLGEISHELRDCFGEFR